MTDGLSPNLQHLETSATVAISAEAKRRKAAGEDVIDLGAGEPDFATPAIPADAGIRAIKDGKTHYSANEGILELRAAAATHLSLLSGGRPVNADHIVSSRTAPSSRCSTPVSRCSARVTSSRFRRRPGCPIPRSCTWRAPGRS